MNVGQLKNILGTDCLHEGYHCSKLILSRHYAVTKAIQHPTEPNIILPEFIRWSTPDDPPFPCLCDCESCNDWRDTKAEVDGPVILPTK